MAAADSEKIELLEEGLDRQEAKFTFFGKPRNKSNTLLLVVEILVGFFAAVSAWGVLVSNEK